jgi:ATP-binding cassette subfamily A (ABC1) protein 3
MVNFCRVLCCGLMWKNCLLKRRMCCSSLLEIGLPVLIMLVMVGIRSAVTVDNKPQANYVDQTLQMNQNYTSFAIQNYLKATNYYGHIVIVPTHDPLSSTINQKFIDYFSQFSFTIPQKYATEQFKAGFNYTLADYLVTDLTFNNEDDLNSYISGSDYGNPTAKPIGTAIVFDQLGSNNPSNMWEYSIRGNSTSGTPTSPDTSQTALDLQWTLDTGFSVITDRGALVFQHFVDNFIIQRYQVDPTQAPQRSLSFTAMPTPAYRSDDFADYVGNFLGLLFTVVFLWPVTRQTKAIVEEKESRIKEGMKMMGLKETGVWLSWFLTYCIVFLIMSIIITIITAGNVFKYSDKGRIFIFFFLFGISTFSFAYLISAFFSRARTASTFAAIVFFLIFFPYYTVYGNDSSAGAKTAACLSAPVCFGLGSLSIIKYEGAGTGVNSNNAGTDLDNFNYNRAVGMLLLDIVLYLVLGLYFYRVLPTEWGTQEKWYFLCTKRFWCPKALDTSGRQKTISNESSGDFLEMKQEYNSPVALGNHIERVSEEMNNRVGVSIRHLRKEFGSKLEGSDVFVAVKDLSLDLYSGQILALLGHNGAGKTTTINMLTGMMAPTAGEAYVYGSPITSDINQIRKILGVCPQHNILFDLLTVREHLHLYAVIKGVSRADCDSHVEEMIDQVGLREKADTKAAALSGGMQRKLSVGIALLGDSKIVFLDEPTSGMDPYSRRATWDLLKKKKEGRVIILTTHFMDEADQLGDRIAIMASGEVKCCGSSLFLKNQYGVGYTLTIVKAENFDEFALTKLIQSHVPAAEQLSNIAGEISFRLPVAASPQFPELFQTFDSNQSEYGITNYGISVTTLEEVFLRVGHDDEESNKSKNIKKSSAVAPTYHVDSSENNSETTGLSTIQVQAAGSAAHHDDAHSTAKLQQLSQQSGDLNQRLQVPTDRDHIFRKHFKALFIKRFHDAKRNKRGWVWTIIIPFIILIVGMAVIQLLNSITFSSKATDTSYLNSPLPIPFAYTDATSVQVFNSASNSQLNFFPAADCRNISACSDYLYSAWPTQQLSTYGAYGANVQNLNPLTDQTFIFFNTTFAYAIPAYLNLYNNEVLRNVASTNPNIPSIRTNYYPLPKTKNQKTLGNSLTAIFIAIAFAFVPAHFVHYSVQEQSVKSKHQQFISGVSAFSYHLANFCWDFLNFLVPACLCMLCLGIFDIVELVGENAGAAFLMIILYGLSIISFCYMCSFLFSNHTTAQNTMLILYILIGAFLLIASIILDIISSTKSVNKGLKWIYRLFPSFCFGESIASLVVRSSPTAYGYPREIWDFDVMGRPAIMMTWEIFGYFAVVLLIEYIAATPALFKFFQRDVKIEANPKILDEDFDVRAERERIAQQFSGSEKKDMIAIQGLRKVYPGRLGGKPKIAVHDLSLGIHEGECFGYLGINGAGKTTTLKMLTNDIYPTSGGAYFNNLDIMTHQADVRHMIGYCPQFDALIATLTAREHLTLFARIKGVSESHIPDLVNVLIERLGLQEGIADRPAGAYSGGNKRKLCVGIALIGNPRIVFLDGKY